MADAGLVRLVNHPDELALQLRNGHEAGIVTARPAMELVTELRQYLEAAVAQLPRQAYQAEARPLHEELDRIHNGGRRGPQPLGDILPIVLARLGVGRVESTGSGEAGPT